MSYAPGTLLFFRPSPIWWVPLLLGQGTLDAGERPMGFGHVAVAVGDGVGNADGSAIQALGSGIVQVGFSPPDAAIPYPGDVDAFMTALRSHLGGRYDYAGLFCVPGWRWFRFCPDGGYAGTAARFCSSLIVDAIRKGDPSLKDVCGTVPSRAVSPDRIYTWASSARKGS